MANVIKEIINRKIHFNEKKQAALYKTQADFTREAILNVANTETKEHVRRGQQTGDYHVKVHVARDILSKHLDLLEANRILGKS